jgi:general nucleoside transport system permease protein
VLTVVIAYEVVRRIGVRIEQRQVAQALERAARDKAEVSA